NQSGRNRSYTRTQLLHAAIKAHKASPLRWRHHFADHGLSGNGTAGGEYKPYREEQQYQVKRHQRHFGNQQYHEKGKENRNGEYGQLSLFIRNLSQVNGSHQRSQPSHQVDHGCKVFRKTQVELKEGVDKWDD